MPGNLSKVMFVIVPIFVICVFILAIVMFLSPKFRTKIMKKQIESTKYMLDESKDSLKDIANIGLILRNDIIRDNKENLKDLANLGIDIKEDIMNSNEERLKNLSRKEAEIDKEKIKIYANSIKEGLSNNQIYCKHCGETIDSDSKFCKKCGKEQ